MARRCGARSGWRPPAPGDAAHLRYRPHPHRRRDRDRGAAGKLLRVIGRPGGRLVGAYDPRRIESPQGIAVDARGQLWVTEHDYQPKRTSLWKADGTYLAEFVGPSQYGGGGLVAPKDPARLYYGGMALSLNAPTGAWAIKRVLTRTQAAFSRGHTNHPATAVDADGRVRVNGRPVLAMAPDGTPAWSYPQAWGGTHDSHRAPAPRPGQLIGGLGFIGQEEIPGLGEAVILSGNKGKWYLFSGDGLLAATLWTDYRTPGAISWHFPAATPG